MLNADARLQYIEERLAILGQSIQLLHQSGLRLINTYYSVDPAGAHVLLSTGIQNLNSERLTLLAEREVLLRLRQEESQ